VAITHEELLAKIDSFTCCSGVHELALRAIVELHKPWLSKHDDLVMCDHCCSEIYPCPTVKVIEKEIG
jgi:hypothetical protein